MTTVATETKTTKATTKTSKQFRNDDRTDEQRKADYQAKRAQLREISNAVKPLVESGDFDNVNQAIIQTYKDQFGFTDLKTFHQWKAEGKSVMKGEKAYVVWGSPQQIAHPDPDAEEDEMEYFPLCYLFSDQQVAERSAK